MMTEDEYRIKVSVRNNLILKAIEDFGYTSVYKFCMENNLSVGVINQIVGFRVKPIGQDGTFNKHAQALMEVLGAAPTDLWTAEQLELSLTKNTVEKEIGQRALDKLLGMDNGELLTIESPEESVYQKEKNLALADVVDSLTPKEQKVLQLRFGLHGEEEHTLEETGNIIDVTRERVRQIEAKALRKLRHPSRRSKLQEVVYD
jgi:RNA polymerase primary sigma factor